MVLGVAYKQDIDDYRESPAIEVIEELEKLGANVIYYDPYIAKYKKNNKVKIGEKELTIDLIKKADVVAVTTAHTKVDYELVQKHAIAIFYTKNAMKKVKDRNKIELL